MSWWFHLLLRRNSHRDRTEARATLERVVRAVGRFAYMDNVTTLCVKMSISRSGVAGDLLPVMLERFVDSYQVRHHPREAAIVTMHWRGWYLRGRPGRTEKHLPIQECLGNWAGQRVLQVTYEQ